MRNKLHCAIASGNIDELLCQYAQPRKITIWLLKVHNTLDNIFRADAMKSK